MLGPLIFEKNKIDLDAPNISITVTDSVASDPGTDFGDLMRNRRNDSGWGTAGSSDAGSTTLIFNMTDDYLISDIIIAFHNLKRYTIDYWNGSAYVDFPGAEAVAVLNNVNNTTHHRFTPVTTSRIRLIIVATQTPNDDKYIGQFIITNRIGQFEVEPFIRKPKQERGRKIRKMLSGRSNITRSLGATSFAYQFPKNLNGADMAILQRMFEAVNGFIVWNCGGTVDQFPMVIPGFRMHDIYLMQCANDFDGEWNDGHFNHGQSTEVQLVESRT